MAPSLRALARRVSDRAVARRFMIANVFGVGAPVVLAACLVPARSSFAPSAAAIIFVALIAAAAIAGTRTAGVFASISSGLWFDFFLTRPYERFAISQRADLETTISLFVVGLIVTELAARGRHYRITAVEESDHVFLIHELSEMVSIGAPANQVVERATDELTVLLHLKGCTFEQGAPQAHRTTVMSDGEVVHGGFLWGITTMGLPGTDLDLPVHFGGRVIGRFVLVPTPGWPVPSERMIVAVAIAGQAGAALATRARIA
jgi:K+-sensing histidine kinase KdpD